MLTQAQRDIIKATVPLLETGGEALTTYFYELLLTEHPALRPMFNQTHQADGAQPRTLARGVLLYARNIDRLEALGPLAVEIVNKHVSLQVQPEHYPLVGDCLLRSIRNVLGAEIATDAVIDAWAAAYGQLADILIGAERQAYDALAAAPGGWRGARAFRVVRKAPESAEITSFYLEPVDGGPVVYFLPGQYVGLRLIVDGREIRRDYSLSAAPNRRSYRISVKRETGGAASGFLHGSVHEGSIVELFPPAGAFTLDDSQRPLLLISGGVGITPTLAMAEAALPTGRPITFIHYARDAAAQGFLATLKGWAARYPQFKLHVVYDQASPAPAPQPDAVGRPEMSQLTRWIADPAACDAYFLGPKPFMAWFKRTLAELGVPEERCHYEFFGPTQALQ